MRPTGLTGVVFDIQPYSVHDGPGIRTLIFMKGCPLKCKWCSNPESQQFKPQWLVKQDKCLAEACELGEDDSGGLHSAGHPMENIADARECPNHAATICGREMTVDELMKVIRMDRHFFGETGGITLSGGEPFSQPKFTRAVLKECKQAGISTAVESSLYVSYERIEQSLPFIDFFMFDIKLMDPLRHKEYCGVDNGLILDNIAELARTANIPLLPRLAVIPGVNDDIENIEAMAKFMRANELHYIHLLSYMNLGSVKYPQLGRVYEMEHTKPPTKKSLEHIKEIFSHSDVFCL